MQYDLRDDAFAALLRLGGAQQDDLRTGQVVSRSISDITLIQTLLQFLPNMTGNALMFLGLAGLHGRAVAAADRWSRWSSARCCG